MRPASTPPHLITLILLTATAVSSLNLFLPALAHMAEAFATDYATMSLAVGGYLAVTTIVQLVAGPLSDRIGRRPVVLGALGIFAAASVGCALSDDIETFLAFRMLQGAVIACLALSMASVRDTTTAQDAATRISYVTMAMALSPMLGPVLGGVLDTAFGWRANFWFYAAAGLAMAALAFADMGETHARGSGESVRHGYATLLRIPRFWGFLACMTTSTAGFYIFIAGAPLVATESFGISSAMLGVLIGSITAGFMLGSFLSTRLTRRIGIVQMMLAGRIVAFVGLGLGAAVLLGGHLSLWTYFGAMIFVGIGNGLTMPSAHSGIMSIRPDLAGTAAGMTGALTVAVGAALTLITGVLLTRADAPLTLLLIMLGSTGIGLVAALLLRRERPART
ncbi:MAG: MFS transporter [Rhizobiales bacterium NRL2]|nr:MAG: MFS transporter [Rhizobiales bacterium NRL2]